MKQFIKKPSKNYLKNIEFYKQMHIEGVDLIDGSKKNSQASYNGRTTSQYAEIIKKIINKNDYKNLFEYGCGKAFYYENSFNLNNKEISSLKDCWDVEIKLYDPCFEKYSKLPNKKSDLTICIDVLEHIPEDDIDWVLNELFELTKCMVFMNIACTPALALLPNGKNAHINIQTPKWWHNKYIYMKNLYKDLKIICCYSFTDNSDKNSKRKFLFSNIDDNIKYYL